MKSRNSISFIFIMLLSGTSPQKQIQTLDKEPTEDIIPEDALKGDFDGDGIEEYVWLEAPLLEEDDMGCVGDCTSYIKFSNPDIPPIRVQNCIGGDLSILGDLNNNKRTEIGLYPHWFSSCWRSYYVWTLKDNEWIYAVDPISTHCQQWENDEFPITKSKKKGHVIIKYSEMSDDYNEITTSTKSVKVNK